MRNARLIFFALMALVGFLACACKQEGAAARKTNASTDTATDAVANKNLNHNQNQNQGHDLYIDGYVGVKGTSNFPTLVFSTKEGERFLLKCPKELSEELSALSGIYMEIELDEEKGKGASGDAVYIKNYRLLPDEEADTAFIGKIIDIGMVEVRDSGKVVAVTGIPEDFFKENLSKMVWIKGKSTPEDKVSVTRFGHLGKASARDKLR